MRKSGILLPITSLSSEYGIGTVGKCAYEFVDFLKNSGQKYWQILPLNPTSFGNSPYQSFSAFAFNPYLIDLDELTVSGLLKKDECRQYRWGDEKVRIDYSLIYENRPKILKTAFERFVPDGEYRRFCEENEFWLNDYAIFMTLKEKYKMKPLSEFPPEARIKNENFIHKIENEQPKSIDFHKFTQFIFFSQWAKLKKYANENGVEIIGDIPIYVSADSADIYSNPKLFCTDGMGRPLKVAGCPPDAFSPNGQLWGNPVYDWQEHEKDDYSWWLRRFSQAQKLFDAVRVDHFRAFYSFYCVQAKATTAKNGEWVRANGEKFFEKVRSAFPNIRIIAEDLGFITDEVRARMASSGFPGMKILQFAFNEENSEYLPHNFTRNSVVYTGTHDNDTLMGWIMSAKKSELDFAMNYLGVHSLKDLHFAIIRSAMSSVADTAIIPLHDYLRQGSDSRINTPSTVGDNWTYRIEREKLDDNLSAKIYRLTKLYSRL